MDTESFIIRVKADDIYKNIAEDVETRFDISTYKLDRSLPKRKSKKGLGLMKDKLGGETMKKDVGLRANLIDNGSEHKKAKGTKKYVIKENLSLKIIKTIKKQLNLKIKSKMQRRNKIDADIQHTNIN